MCHFSYRHLSEKMSVPSLADLLGVRSSSTSYPVSSPFSSKAYIDSKLLWAKSIDNDDRSFEQCNPHFAYCRQHEAVFPVDTEGKSNKKHPDCKICWDRAREIRVVPIDEARKAYLFAKEEYKQLRSEAVLKYLAVDDNKPKTMSMLDVPDRSEVAWLEYDYAAFRVGCEIRKEFMETQKIDQMSPDVQHLLNHCDDATKRMYTFVNSSSRAGNVLTPQAFCSKHNCLGDAYPFRPAKQYEADCGMCLVDSEQPAARMATNRWRMGYRGGMSSASASFDVNQPTATIRSRFKLDDTH